MKTNSHEEVKTMETTKQEATMKVCSKCNGQLPSTTEYFSKNMSTSDHLERWCKTCKGKAGKEIRDRKRKERDGLAEKKKRGGNGRKRREKIPVNPPAPVGQIQRVTPEDLFKAVRLSHAEEACKIIVEKFAPGYEIILRPKMAKWSCNSIATVSMKDLF